jgi:hypothetical protein
MTTVKFITALLTLTFFLSCRQNPSGDNSYIAKGAITDTANNISSDAAKADRWNFKKYLNDPKTPQLAKDIFNNKWQLKDDEPLEFLEQLHGLDKETRPFYFRVVTNSYKQSDGAYSEGLGNAGYEYVKNYPHEFSSYFVGQDAFSDNDLQTWADIAMLEFQIISEDEYDTSLVKVYLDTVRRNCKDCSSQQKEVIEKFGYYLNQRFREFLKRMDQ